MSLPLQQQSNMVWYDVVRRKGQYCSALSSVPYHIVWMVWQQTGLAKNLPKVVTSTKSTSGKTSDLWMASQRPQHCTMKSTPDKWCLKTKNHNNWKQHLSFNGCFPGESGLVGYPQFFATCFKTTFNRCTSFTGWMLFLSSKAPTDSNPWCQFILSASISWGKGRFSLYTNSTMPTGSNQVFK